MTMSTQAGTLTQPQLRKIWVSARGLGWDGAKLHQELERVIGVMSLRELSRRDARLFIDFLVSEGASSGRHLAKGVLPDEPKPTPASENVIQLATPAQWDLIRSLLQQLGWTVETEYFLGCLKKATGRTRIRTRQEASMAITILQKIKARRLESATEADPENGTGARPA